MEQRQPLLKAFIDLAKSFDLISNDGLFKILPKIGCPPTLLSFIKPFHEDMKGTVTFDGSTSHIRSGVKHSCVLALTLFGIFATRLLKLAFGSATEGIYLRTRSDEKLFKLSNLRQRLHERGFKASRFHALETASKSIRFQSVYTVPISPFSNVFSHVMECTQLYFGCSVSTVRDMHSLVQERMAIRS